jgi:hypothetical protein
VTDFQLDFSAPVSTGDGFQAMTFTLSENGAGVIDQTFDSAGAAEAYFTNLDLNLPDANQVSMELDITGDGFEVGTTLGGNSPFSTVPEPDVWGIILSGVGMLMAFQRPRRRL